MVATSAGLATVMVGSGVAAADGGVSVPEEVVKAVSTAASESSGGGAAATSSGDEFLLRSAAAAPRKAYYDGKRTPSIRYAFEGSAPTDVRIEVIDVATQAIVASFIDPAALPNVENIATWNGRTVTGALAPNGDYAYRIGSAASAKVETTAEAAFGFYKFRFPIRAKHEYGDGFGAGRGHQGQDVFARCGAKLVAARGGRVQWNKTHSAAGNYVVIDGKGTKSDFMYAHLAARSPLAQGTRVRTAQVIGQVGDSGNASGCHLHFEVWSGPGWYEGGSALPSVTRMLQSWDRWS